MTARHASVQLQQLKCNGFFRSMARWNPCIVVVELSASRICLSYLVLKHWPHGREAAAQKGMVGQKHGDWDLQVKHDFAAFSWQCLSKPVL